MARPLLPKPPSLGQYGQHGWHSEYCLPAQAEKIRINRTQQLKQVLLILQWPEAKMSQCLSSSLGQTLSRAGVNGASLGWQWQRVQPKASSEIKSTFSQPSLWIWRENSPIQIAELSRWPLLGTTPIKWWQACLPSLPILRNHNPTEMHFCLTVTITVKNFPHQMSATWI